MHTQVSLTSIGQLIDGTHENPSSVLGPHPVDYLGEEAVAVRTYLPQARAGFGVLRGGIARIRHRGWCIQHHREGYPAGWGKVSSRNAFS